MNRTRNRPLVSGQLGKTTWVPWAAILMILAPSLILLPFNPALAFFLFLGAFIYVVVYTLWLKPRTTLNIVIGGAAGSYAVLSGAAAAGNWADPGALLLAALVFLWTPIHFWSLAARLQRTMRGPMCRCCRCGRRRGGRPSGAWCTVWARERPPSRWPLSPGLACSMPCRRWASRRCSGGQASRW